MVNVTLAYSAVATNLSTANLAIAFAALPLDDALSDLAGLTLVSDNTTNPGGNLVTRTIVYQTSATPPLFSDAQIGAMCTTWYTVEFSKALATLVTAAPVVVS